MRSPTELLKFAGVRRAADGSDRRIYNIRDDGAKVLSLYANATFDLQEPLVPPHFGKVRIRPWAGEVPTCISVGPKYIGVRFPWGVFPLQVVPHVPWYLYELPNGQFTGKDSGADACLSAEVLVLSDGTLVTATRVHPPGVDKAQAVRDEAVAYWRKVHVDMTHRVDKRTPVDPIWPFQVCKAAEDGLYQRCFDAGMGGSFKRLEPFWEPSMPHRLADIPGYVEHLKRVREHVDALIERHARYRAKAAEEAAARAAIWTPELEARERAEQLRICEAAAAYLELMS